MFAVPSGGCRTVPQGQRHHSGRSLTEDHHRVRDTGALHVLFRGKDDVARILRQRAVLRVVDDHGIARHGQRGDLAEGIHHGRRNVRDEYHVALLHHGVAVVRRIEADAVLHRFLAETRGGDSHVAIRAADVHHFKVQHLHVVFTDELDHFLCSFEHEVLPPNRV